MKEKYPLVSVITVCFNEEQRIEETAYSIVSQLSNNYEWIVIDGGSTDNTLEILNRYKKSITLLISEKDGGVYNAMNKGIRLAKGEFCIFINGGDKLFDEQALLKFEQSEDKADVNYGAIFEINTVKGKSTNKFEDPVGEYKYYLYHRCLPHQSSFIRRKLFQKYGFYDESFIVNADWDFCAKAIVRYNASLKHLPFLVAVFYFDGISATTKGSKENRTESRKIRKEYFDWEFKARLFINRLISKLVGRNI